MQLRRCCTYLENNFSEKRVAFQSASVYVLSVMRGACGRERAGPGAGADRGAR
jgi:hypothetical protein